jgi:adenylate cyclase class IV
MLEVELKAVVPDLPATRQRLERAGAPLRFAGQLEDRRYDDETHTFAARDHVLRLRVYRNASGGAPSVSAALDWKGPTSYDSGYKQREELSSGIADPSTFEEILGRLGLVVTMAIDRDIWQYDLMGATVRFERYPRMDDLVEVEGAPEAIEDAIRVLGVPREAFTSERLPSFVRRFEARTGQRAALSQAELTGAAHYELDNA